MSNSQVQSLRRTKTTVFRDQCRFDDQPNCTHSRQVSLQTVTTIPRLSQLPPRCLKSINEHFVAWENWKPYHFSANFYMALQRSNFRKIVIENNQILSG